MEEGGGGGAWDEEVRYVYAGWRVVGEHVGRGDTEKGRSGETGRGRGVWGARGGGKGKVQENGIAQRRRGKPSTKPVLRLVRQYVYGNYIDEVVQGRYDKNNDGDMEDVGEVFYYVHNSQYSISALTDAAGDVVEYYRYMPYGEVRVYVSPGADGEWFTEDDEEGTFSRSYYAFTGRRLDPESGLYYFRNRYYSAGLGRFVTRDPEGYVDGLNMYRGYFVPNGVDAWGEKCGECLPPITRPNHYNEHVVDITLFFTPSAGFVGEGISVVEIMRLVYSYTSGGITGALDPSNLKNLWGVVREAINPRKPTTVAEERLQELHDVLMGRYGFQVELSLTWESCDPCRMPWYYRIVGAPCESGEWKQHGPKKYKCKGWYQKPGGALPYPEFDQQNYSKCVEEAINAIPSGR